MPGCPVQGYSGRAQAAESPGDAHAYGTSAEQVGRLPDSTALRVVSQLTSSAAVAGGVKPGARLEPDTVNSEEDSAVTAVRVVIRAV